MDVELRHLRVVVAIADHGSITRVAAHLGVSQPAMSAQLRRVERAFGGRLFERGRGGVRPTSLGEMVVARCRAITAEVDAMLAAGRQHVDRDVALVLGANNSQQFSTVLGHLVEMGLGHDVLPRVDVSSVVLQALLLDGSVDLALIGVHPGFDDDCPPGIEELVVVEREPFLLAISAWHPLADAREIQLADLGDESWLLPPGRPDGTDAALRAAWTAAGIEPPTPYGRQEIETFWPYIAAGKAVAACLPMRTPPAGSIFRPLAGTPIYGREVLRWNPVRVDAEMARLHARAAARAFVDRLRRTAQRQAWWEESPEHRPVLGPGLLV